MKFNSWEERKDFLVKTQELLHKEFGKDNYNVFLFGSFITNRYDPERSDIDMAVYSNNFIFTRQIMNWLEDYLCEVDVPHSLIIIDESQKYAFVALDPLTLNIGMTDYFPMELRSYKMRLTSDLIHYNEEQKLIKRLFPN